MTFVGPLQSFSLFMTRKKHGHHWQFLFLIGWN